MKTLYYIGLIGIGFVMYFVPYTLKTQQTGIILVVTLAIIQILFFVIPKLNLPARKIDNIANKLKLKYIEKEQKILEIELKVFFEE